MATKEATEAKEEAAAKALIKEEATAKALEKEDQGEELKTRWCEGISHVQFEFWIFSKKNFSIKTKEKLNFNRTFEQKIKPKKKL